MENSYIKKVLKQQFAEAKKNGITAKQICQEIGISEQSLHAYWKSHLGSFTITESLIKYFNLKIIKIY